MIRKKSYAKINLFLKTTGRRPDGFHKIESVMAFLDLYDELKISTSEKFDLKIDGEFAPILAESTIATQNILVKILDFFVENFALSKNLSIKLTKNIPVSAGLGGGSSNAATFMKMLNELFSLNLSTKKLQEISLNFGSDIAFLLGHETAIVKGRGELIENFPHFEPISCLVVNPKISVSTKEIFTRLSSNFSQEITNQELQKISAIDLIKNFQNDLTKPAIATLPIIAEILEELQKQPTIAAKMSGSGATCFAIFNDETEVQIAAQNIKQKFPDYFVKPSKILSHV